MHPYSMALFFSATGLTVLAAAVSLAYTLRVFWRAARATSTTTSRWSQSLCGLFGALLFTSAPFTFLAYSLAGQKLISMPGDLFVALVPIGGLRYTLSWIPLFLFGFALFAFAWARTRRKHAPKA